jgi:hypothetical protein
MAPGSVRTKKHDQIGGAITTVLAIVTLGATAYVRCPALSPAANASRKSRQMRTIDFHRFIKWMRLENRNAAPGMTQPKAGVSKTENKEIQTSFNSGESNVYTHRILT